MCNIYNKFNKCKHLVQVEEIDSGITVEEMIAIENDVSVEEMIAMKNDISVAEVANLYLFILRKYMKKRRKTLSFTLFV